MKHHPTGSGIIFYERTFHIDIVILAKVRAVLCTEAFEASIGRHDLSEDAIIVAPFIMASRDS